MIGFGEPLQRADAAPELRIDDRRFGVGGFEKLPRDRFAVVGDNPLNQESGYDERRGHRADDEQQEVRAQRERTRRAIVLGWHGHTTYHAATRGENRVAVREVRLAMRPSLR